MAVSRPWSTLAAWNDRETMLPSRPQSAIVAQPACRRAIVDGMISLKRSGSERALS